MNAVQIVVVGGDAAHVAQVAREVADYGLDWRLQHAPGPADVAPPDSPGTPDVLVVAARPKAADCPLWPRWRGAIPVRSGSS